MSWRGNTGNKEDWETRKKQILRSFFADVAELTPIPENKEHAPTPDHPPLPIEDSRSSGHSSLPDLILEREPKRYQEENSDRFYDKLELKTKKYMARLERGEPSDNTDISSTEDIDNEEKKSTTANSNKSDYDTINEPNYAIQESSNDFMDEENTSQSEDSENEEKKSTTANSNKSDYDTINEPNDAIQESSNDFMDKENKSQSEDSENEENKSTTANSNKSDYDTINEPNDAIQESSNDFMDEENTSQSEDSENEENKSTTANSNKSDYDTINEPNDAIQESSNDFMDKENTSQSEDSENQEKKSTTANSNKSDYDTINEPNDAIQESSNDFMDEENTSQSEDSVFEVLRFEVKAEIHANDDDSVNGKQQIGNLKDIISETYTIENNSDESENEDSHTIISCPYTTRTELVDDEEQEPKEILNEDNISIKSMEYTRKSQEEEIETMRGNVLVTQRESVQDDPQQKSEEMFDIQTKQAPIHDENAIFEDFELFRSSTPISKEFCKTSIKRVLRDNTNRGCESKPTKRRRVSTKSVCSHTADVVIDYLECESKLPKRRRVTKSVCTQITDDVTDSTGSDIDWDELKNMLAGNPESSQIYNICKSGKNCEGKTLSTSNKVSELLQREQSISVKPTDHEKNTPSDTSSSEVADEMEQ